MGFNYRCKKKVLPPHAPIPIGSKKIKKRRDTKEENIKNNENGSEKNDQILKRSAKKMMIKIKLIKKEVE